MFILFFNSYNYNFVCKAVMLIAVHYIIPILSYCFSVTLYYCQVKKFIYRLKINGFIQGGKHIERHIQFGFDLYWYLTPEQYCIYTHYTIRTILTSW